MYMRGPRAEITLDKKPPKWVSKTVEVKQK
jgi:hypothetical protein